MLVWIITVSLFNKPTCSLIGHGCGIRSRSLRLRRFLSVSITTLAAYAFSRFRFSGRETMLKGILLIQVFPGLLAMVAIFTLISQIGRSIPALGLNTHAGLIMVYLGGAMGINIWLMKGFLTRFRARLMSRRWWMGRRIGRRLRSCCCL